MAVKIETIQIKKLGPLTSFQFDLGMLNLIYGHNESGKTYLTEFLLRSIFRHASTWNLRDINPEGSVKLVGLEEKSSNFSPGSPKKIEDYWLEKDLGLPLNMARLLIVKGGELALSDNTPGGVSRETLKNALTSQALLDQLRDSIQPTVQKAEIIDQKILGKNQGQINDLNKLQIELSDIVNLLNLIEENYSMGPVRQIEDQINHLEGQLDQQNLAKNHHAFLLSKKLQNLQILRENISDDKFLSLRDLVRDHKKLKTDLQNLSERIAAAQSDIERYHWLESAIKIWEERELENKALPEKILIVIGGILLFSGLLTAILQNIYSWQGLFWSSIGTAVIGGFLLGYFGVQLLKVAKNASDAAERESIRSVFKEKFGQTLKSAASLRAEQSNFQEIFHKTKNRQEEIGKLEIKLDSEQQKIINAFKELAGETINQELWETNLDTIKTQAAALDGEIADLTIEIARLNLKEADYIADPQEVEYSPQTQLEIERQLSSLNDKLVSQQSGLETLKVRAAEWTRDEISSPWSEVLHNLRTLRSAISQKHIELTAEIAAKIGLSEILRKIEREEDQKILENINSGEVSSLLTRLTGKYQSLNLIDDQLYASDPYQEFPLRDLSTGAREQIQLALRLGIASHISGGEPLFIILDDAFQHSDWDRRQSLVKETVDLAKNGWQIIYLTMDDHIRDLFQETAKPVLKSKFKYLKLD